MGEKGSRVEQCGTCRFWQEQPTVDGGRCRRHAPRPRVMTADEDAGDDEQYVVWPLMLNTEWCGEWQGERPEGGA